MNDITQLISSQTIADADGTKRILTFDTGAVVTELLIPSAAKAAMIAAEQAADMARRVIRMCPIVEGGLEGDIPKLTRVEWNKLKAFIATLP